MLTPTTFAFLTPYYHLPLFTHRPLSPPSHQYHPHLTQVANLADEEIPQIYATCGRGARSTLRVLRPGLAVTGKAAAGWRGCRGGGGRRLPVLAGTLCTG